MDMFILALNTTFSSRTFTFRDIGKKLNAYLAKIRECRKYAIFGVYLTINPEESVYGSFYCTTNIILCLGELTECPRFAWCAPEMLKMANEVAKFCRE